MLILLPAGNRLHSFPRLHHRRRTALALLVIIAVWALVTGVLEIVGAVRLRKEIRGEWLLILSGILSLVFAYILLSNPGAGALAHRPVCGCLRILLMILGFRIHRMMPV